MFISFERTPYSSPVLSPGSFEPEIGVIAESPESFETARFTVNNPSLDLAPNTDGVLSGIFRISLQAINQKSAKAKIGLVLPLQAKLEVQDGGGSQLLMIGKIPKPTYTITCDPSAYPRDKSIVDARLVISATGIADQVGKWEFACAEKTMTAWYTLPQTRIEGSVSRVIDGSSILTAAVAEVTFNIPNYPGIRRSAFDTWHTYVSLDNNNRGDSVPLSKVAQWVSKTADFRTVVSLHANDDNQTLTHIVPGNYDEIAKPFYQLGPVPTWGTAFGSDVESFSADVVDGDKTQLYSLVTGTFWNFVWVLIPLLIGFTVWMFRIDRRDRITHEAELAAAIEAAREKAARDRAKQFKERPTRVYWGRKRKGR